MFWKKKIKKEVIREMPPCGEIETHYSFEDAGIWSLSCPLCRGLKKIKEFKEAQKQAEEKEKLDRELLAELIADKVIQKLKEKNGY